MKEIKIENLEINAVYCIYQKTPGPKPRIYLSFAIVVGFTDKYLLLRDLVSPMSYSPRIMTITTCKPDEFVISRDHNEFDFVFKLTEPEILNHVVIESL